ncbi:MAG: putative colanic acid biosynthesis acetyltransferase [Planctomycetes bacterium]|nr:putative colanic acid biosynthesis acetyltransferase [Planctomycetota bacterium]
MSELPKQAPSGHAARIRQKNPDQENRHKSPWSLKERLGMLAWIIVDRLLCRPVPKQFNGWRLFWLRLFGCKITGRPMVHPAAIVKIPWQLTLEDRAAVGPHAEIYNLGHVTLRELSVISQYAYICGGTHNLEDPMLPLLVGDIEIGREVFVGAKALILPGVKIEEGAVIGAGSVVSRDMPAWMICAGNPCRPIKARRKI